LKQVVHTPRVITLILVVALALFGCRENVLINSKASPSGNAVNIYSVSLPCQTYTYYSDSVITSTNIGGIPMFQAVGSFVDPYFGTMTGATFFQVIPAYATSDTLTGYTVDSAVLVLPYSGFTYGDTLAATGSNIVQTYQVFYMNDTMSVSNTYYSSSDKPIDLAHPLSDPTPVNIYHLKDSVGLNTRDANHPGLRIKLNWPVLRSHLYPALQGISTTSTNPNQDFMNAFNGICVRVADTRQTANAIPYFQLDGGTTFSTAGVILYYHATGATVDSDAIQAFSFSSAYCGHFNSIAKSYSHYPVNNLLQAGKAETKVIALQNQPGASIDLVIPGIKSLPKGVINKAELQLTLLRDQSGFYGTYDTLFAPERLYPTGIANATYPPNFGLGVAYNVADRYPIYSTSPLIVMDGFMHTFPFSLTATKQTFTIDIPREVMYSDSLKNDTLHLHIGGTEDFYGAFHFVAGGGNYGVDGTSDTLYRAKLIVTYSKLNN